MSRLLLVAAMAIAGISSAIPASASWAYIPPVVLIAEADAVIVGKMTQVDRAAGTGVLVVEKVLLGPAELKEAKVKFSPMPPGGLIHDAMVSYDDGQEGIWILRNKDKAGVYPMDYPMLHMGKAQLAEVERLVKIVQESKWSEPVEGLAATCIVAPAARRSPHTAYVFVKNTTDKPIRLNHHIGAKLIEAVVVAPDGKAATLDLYGYLARGRVADPKPADYRELPAGGVVIVGPREGFRMPLTDQPGEHKLRVTYANTDDGSGAEIKDVWTGKIVLPEATIPADQEAGKQNAK